MSVAGCQTKKNTQIPVMEQPKQTERTFLISDYCRVASEQQHQDLRRIYYVEMGTNSRIHHFLPECFVFKQCIAPLFTRGCHTVEASSVFPWIPVNQVNHSSARTEY